MSRYSETGKEPPIVEVTGGCVSPDMCCEQNSGPLQKHYVLWTAEPPLLFIVVMCDIAGTQSKESFNDPCLLELYSDVSSRSFTRLVTGNTYDRNDR